MSSNMLADLEALRLVFGSDAARRKRDLLARLDRTVLGSAAQVRRLHEALCFLRAYPDDAALLRRVVRMLDRFERRADLRTHRATLAGSGIAGTAIPYRFFAGQAQWLARHWPRQLALDRSDVEAGTNIARALPALLSHAEAVALAESHADDGYAALDQARARRMTDAAFLLGRIAALPGNTFTREAASDAIDASYRLEPGTSDGRPTPSRTRAHLAGAPVAWRRTPPPLARPDLRAELARAPRAVRRLRPGEAAAVLELAREAMVTRARSLEAFSFGDAREGWWVDDGDGLVYAFTGMDPERRHALAASFGGLALRNGVPVGYLQSDHVGAGAALSFNTFETFRGAEAAHLFARWLAALRHLFGTTSFHIDPYQLGRGNAEATATGAWWFYAKLGFAPRLPALQALQREEQARNTQRPGRRTPEATLQRLASAHLYFDLGRARARVPLDRLGGAVGALLSAQAGSDREGGAEALARALQAACGLAAPQRLGERVQQAWRRLAPVLHLVGAPRWPAAERAGLVEVVRAKAAAGERGYLGRYLAHPRLDAAVQAWAQRQRAP